MSIPTSRTDQSDLSIAVVAAQAAFRAAEAARADPLNARAKSVSADLVTDADAKAEAAAVEVLRAHRPDDAIIGEEGADDGGDGAPLVHRRHRRHGRLREPDRDAGAARSCSTTGRRRSTTASELYTAAARRGRARQRRRRCASAPAARSRRPTSPPSSARTASSCRACAPTRHRLLDATGLLRHAGPGTLELAWVAAGRLDAWIQPETDPWDWLPGALLVTEAGGVATIVERDVRWHIAGSSALVDELVALLT